MAVQATGSFDPNQFYRFTNVALGGAFSLDVLNPPVGAPDGSLVMSPSGPYSGQVYQILEDDPGHYFISCAFLGAKYKLDAYPNADGNYAPHLRGLTLDYAQTWLLTPHVDDKNRTSWTLVPDFVTGGSQSMSIVNLDGSEATPVLVPSLSGSELQNGTGLGQLWFLTAEGVTIDDPTFSATHLPTLATEAPIIPDGEDSPPDIPAYPTTFDPLNLPTASSTTSSATASSTTSSGSSSGSGSGNGLAGPLIAVAVIPSVIFAIALAAFCTCIYLRRRRRRKMEENHPYFGSIASAGRSRDRSSYIVSEILDTFEAYSASTHAHQQQQPSQYASTSSDVEANKRRLLPFSLSLVSSNLSRTWRGASSASAVAGEGPASRAPDMANPLSAPPLWRKSALEKQQQQPQQPQQQQQQVEADQLDDDEDMLEKPTLAVRRDQSRDQQEQDETTGRLVPRLKPLKAASPAQQSPRGIRWPSSPKWPRSPGSPKRLRPSGWTTRPDTMAKKKRTSSQQEANDGGPTKQTEDQSVDARDSLDYYIYESIGGGRNDTTLKRGKTGQAS